MLKTIYVEDVLPSWRLLRIVASIKESFWSDDRRVQDYEARHNLASKAGIPTPELTIKTALTQPFSGPNAWVGNDKANDIPEGASLSEYFFYTEQEVRRAFQIRDIDSLALISPKKVYNIQPTLEFHKDLLSFYDNPAIKHSDMLLQRMYVVLLFNSAAISLLYDGNISDLLHFQDCYSNRMALHGPISDIQKNIDVKIILNKLLDPAIFKLFVWDKA